MKPLLKLFRKDALHTAPLERISGHPDSEDVIELESQPRQRFDQSKVQPVQAQTLESNDPHAARVRAAHEARRKMRAQEREQERAKTRAQQERQKPSSAPAQARFEPPHAETIDSAPPDLQPQASHAARAPSPALGRAPEMVPIDAADREDFARTVMIDGSTRLIGDMLRAQALLTAAQVDAVLAHQAEHRTRFGESAVALGYVKSSDVMWALSQQFGYDYAPTMSPAEAEAFSDDLVVAKHPFSQAAEVIRDLRSQLLQSVLNPDALPRRALALVSPDSGDGKTWFAANLAVSLSQLGARTLLIDANLRTPRLHRVFGLEEPKTGLSGILSRRHRADVMRPVRELPHLYLLPAGVVPPNPLEILQGRGFGELMLQLRSKFTHVIVDTPALSRGADARVVAARCGASVLVARRHHSSLPVLQQAARHLGKGDAQFAGVVINDL